MISWYDEVSCDNCGERPVSHINVVTVLIPSLESFLVGAYNVCEKSSCATTLRLQAQSRLDYSGVEQQVWYHDDEFVRSSNWLSSQL